MLPQVKCFPNFIIVMIMISLSSSVPFHLAHSILDRNGRFRIDPACLKPCVCIFPPQMPGTGRPGSRAGGAQQAGGKCSYEDGII